MESLKSQILIVEDQKLVARDIAATLESGGYGVCGMFVNGELALRKITELSPDLILLDIRILGEVDGIEVAEYIQAFYNIPFIYLTGSSDAETLKRAGKTKPQGYIIKPYQPNQLLSAVSMALATARSEVTTDKVENYGRFTKITTYLKEHIDRDITLNEMANLMSMNSSYFCRAFHQEVGISPYQFVLRQRIEKAKTLLKRDRHSSISDIAQYCGFTNHSMLDKHFRKIVGTTPSLYREQLQA